MEDILVNSLTKTVQNLSAMIAHFLPRLIAMIAIIVIGGIIAWILKIIVRRFLWFVKFNQICETTGFTQMLAKAALSSLSEFFSRFVFWLVLIIILRLGFNALKI